MAKNTGKDKEKKLKVAVIREELVKLCEGDAVAALVLNQAVVSHEATKTMDETTEEVINGLIEEGHYDLAKKVKEKLREGWFYKSPNSFFKEIMISSRSTVFRRLEYLVSKGYMIKGGSRFKEIKQHGKDVEDTWWQVNIQKIRKDLAENNHALHGYEVWIESEEEESNPVHGEQGGVHGEQGGVHGGHQQRLHHRLPSKNTSKITNKESIYREEIENINLPVSTKKVLLEKIDRLINNNISVFDILENYEFYKEDVNESQYNSALKYAFRLKKFTGSLEDVMAKNVDKQLEFAKKRADQKPERKIIRKEVTPDFMKEDGKKEEEPASDSLKLEMALDKLNYSPKQLTEEDITLLKKRGLYKAPVMA